MTLTRRDALTLTASGLATAFVLPSRPASAQSAPATVSPEVVAVAGPLGDVVLGSPNAPVWIVEYASLTCGHCAAFHKETFPALKSRYIDAGKVRFILREFPLDPRAAAGFMLARCESDKFYPIVDLLFEKQEVWAFGQRPLDELQKLMRQAGFTQEKFESCLKDQKLYDAVNAVKDRGFQTLKVESTPTFFINGQRHVGNMSIDALERIIKPMLGS
jgi:protein-disulfide isomerase